VIYPASPQPGGQPPESAAQATAEMAAIAEPQGHTGAPMQQGPYGWAQDAPGGEGGGFGASPLEPRPYADFRGPQEGPGTAQPQAVPPTAFAAPPPAPPITPAPAQQEQQKSQAKGPGGKSMLFGGAVAATLLIGSLAFAGFALVHGHQAKKPSVTAAAP